MQISEMRRADALNSEAVLGMMISADSGLEACRYKACGYRSHVHMDVCQNRRMCKTI